MVVRVKRDQIKDGGKTHCLASSSFGSRLQVGLGVRAHWYLFDLSGAGKVNPLLKGAGGV